MREVAFFLQKAIFVSLIVSAPLRLVFLIQLLPLFLSWRREALIHSHIVHHVLLRELTLSIVRHHAHHG